MGPVWAMWRYAIQNPEEAFEAYKQWQFEYGNFPTFRDFCEDVYDHANTTKSTVTNEDDKKEFKKKYLPEITEVVNEKDSVAV